MTAFFYFTISSQQLFPFAITALSFRIALAIYALPARFARSPIMMMASLYSIRNDDVASKKPTAGKRSLTWCRQQATIARDDVAEPAMPNFSVPDAFPDVRFLWYLKSPICTPTAKGIRYTNIPFVRKTENPSFNEPSAMDATRILKRITMIPAAAPNTKGFLKRFLKPLDPDIFTT